MRRPKKQDTEVRQDLRIQVKPETFKKIDALAEKTNRTRATTVDQAIAVLYAQEFPLTEEPNHD